MNFKEEERSSKTPYRVLIVEDVPTDAELNERAVQEVLTRCVFERVETEEAFKKALDDFKPDLIISDYKMPAFDGMTALKLRLERTPLTPFILVTGSMNEDTAVDCMRAGASNYVIKQHLKRLGPAVLHALEERDIRIERLKAQNALVESEDKYRTLVEHAGEAISVAQDGMLKFANKKNEEVSGYTRQELMSRPFIDFVHPDDRSIVTERHMKRLQNIELPARYVIRIVHRSGETRWLDMNVVVINWEGKPASLNFMSDITEQKRAEEEMQKLSAAVEYSADWVLITDLKGTIEYVNKSVEKISGYAREELIGKNPRIFKSGTHGDKFYKSLWDSILSGNDFSGILINRRKTGELFELHYTLTPLKDQQGNIHHFVATAKDITQQKLLEERLDYTAYYDALTGLPNRSLFADRLTHAAEAAGQKGVPVGVIVADIDRFTILNDTLGYERGDELLKRVGRRLSGAICEECTVARFEADKFGILVVNTGHSEDLIMVVEKIRSIFKRPFKLRAEEVIVTLSMGISIFPGDGSTAEMLVKNADVALAKAKLEGMNTYEFFTGEINMKASEFIRLQRHLFDALGRREFIMHFQPYFDIPGRKIVGMEALIRWNSPKFGLVSPGQFIPILEETGMILDVGKWIIETVCRQVKAWMDKGLTLALVPVYVNLSVAQFVQKDLIDFVMRAIGETGIYPSLLGFEITESIFMQNVKHTRSVLEDFKRKGILVNIDDFGTGYSSLSNLKRLPVNNLKIDISFIRDIAANPDDASIVITIISMAHNLNLKTIAEGVETEEQWRILRILKCDMAQGYLLSKPLPAEEVEGFFRR